MQYHHIKALSVTVLHIQQFATSKSAAEPRPVANHGPYIRRLRVHQPPKPTSRIGVTTSTCNHTGGMGQVGENTGRNLTITYQMGLFIVGFPIH